MRVLAGTADEVPLANASVDAVVASLVLCSVPDQQRALAEIRRVLRPCGELRFYEHVIPRCQPKRVLLQVADRSGLWPAIAGGCHPGRDTIEAITQAGFDIEALERFAFAPQRFQPSIPKSWASPAPPTQPRELQSAGLGIPRATPFLRSPSGS